MNLAFPWPYSQGEWLAWAVAAITVLMGLAFLFAPRASLRLLRLQTTATRPETYSAVRGTLAGFHIGLGLCAILFAQPFIYMTLGVAWGMEAFGRIVSILSEGGGRVHAFFMLVFSLVMAALPLAYAIGITG